MAQPQMFGGMNPFARTNGMDDIRRLTMAGAAPWAAPRWTGFEWSGGSQPPAGGNGGGGGGGGKSDRDKDPRAGGLRNGAPPVPFAVGGADARNGGAGFMRGGNIDPRLALAFLQGQNGGGADPRMMAGQGGPFGFAPTIPGRNF